MVNLRDALLNGLKSLPGTREFHLHVLVSSPRKHNGLYPYAQPRCRSYLQDVLILLSEQSTPDSPRVFVTAIEACVYNLPTTSSAILYISKVDSTGQGSFPSPTATLVISFLSYYADPATSPITVENLWIQLFARAQNQYLFPNSSEFSGKRPLNDVKLCGWWKRVYTNVVNKITNRLPPTALLKLYYLIPGYSQLEADHSLNIAGSLFPPHDGPRWTYGHPFSQTEIPLPCSINRTGSGTEDIVSWNLGTVIPSFDDDPKSRFMDELAHTDKEGLKSPPRKRPRTVSNTTDNAGTMGPVADKVDSEKPLGELAKVTPDEFWERMSFRQECVAGAVTGFFTMVIRLAADSQGGNGKIGNIRSAVSPLAPRAGQVSSNLNKRVIASLMTAVEFSTPERAIHATESIESTIKGLCEGITSISTPIFRAPRPQTAKMEGSQGHDPPATSLEPPKTPPPRNRRLPDVSPNPFPEPEPTLETYNSYIYGSICVSNAPKSQNQKVLYGANEMPSAPQVTVLTVRKKKKRAE
ncbi:hypothetical protein E1B28_012528 [Marasmius oreades]|uniref:histone acetyltransferase n=1 Tax=Marasmius oreades TaxID=181124 RepID=A0A9P7UQ07_9AGAR|nr:uncharacterized protein E1B28_012528 [Marasmius oreades]KAG7088546.1 hypothetical protein E1B28_012528 [Marasmius oreades]